MHPVDHIKRFVNLSQESEERLRAMMREHTFKKGGTLRGAGNLLSFTFFILKGAARLYYTANGKEHTISFAFEDQFIVISRELLRDYEEALTIEFLEPTRVVFIPHFKVKDLLKEEKVVSDVEGLLFMNTALMEHCHFTEERLRMMQSCDASQRFQWLIKKFPRVLETANLTQIASYLGIAKETLYRLRAKDQRNPK